MVGIESIEKCFELAAKNIILGSKISKDGVGVEDMVFAKEAFDNIKELVEFVASKPDILEEIKDIDFAEGFSLIQKAYAKYQEVKEAIE